MLLNSFLILLLLSYFPFFLHVFLLLGYWQNVQAFPIFFSKNITEETTASELAHYIGLEESPVIWADKIVKVVEDYMPKRRSYAAEVKINGFDSKSEALRMQSFYLAQINSVDGYERNS